MNKLYYHELIFMPAFDFEIDFWQHIDEVVVSGHAAMRQHMRVLPTPSLDFIRSGHVYECCIDKDGINYVCVRCSWFDDSSGGSLWCECHRGIYYEN